MSAKIMKPGMGDMSKTPGMIKGSGAKIQRPQGSYKTGANSFNSGTSKTNPSKKK